MHGCKASRASPPANRQLHKKKSPRLRAAQSEGLGSSHMTQLKLSLAAGKPFITCALPTDSLRAQFLNERFGLSDALSREVAYLALGEPREGGVE